MEVLGVIFYYLLFMISSFLWKIMYFSEVNLPALENIVLFGYSPYKFIYKYQL